VTLFPLAATSLGEFGSALVPWARLVSTFSLVWLIPRLVLDDKDRRFVIGAVEASIVLAVGRAVAEFGFDISSRTRLRGDIGPNAFGLISATLIVLALHCSVPRSKILRWSMAALGLLGLASAKSVGSFVATGVVLGVAGFGYSRPRLQAAIRPLRIAALAFSLLAIIGAVRPESLPGSTGFYRSSAQARLIYAAAGMHIFEQNPLLGVGWQRSNRPDVIGDPELSNALREEFPDAPSDYVPDQQATNSVHNAYIQSLAEAGICGAIALLVLLVVASRRIRRLVASLSGDSAVVARAAMLVSALTLIWLNDNPLYGAQPETVILATMLGLLASFGRVRESDEEPAAAELTLADEPRAVR
jgi:O-antigen ligase